MALVTNDFKDGFLFTGLTSGSAGPFTILGGKYGFSVVDTGTPDANLNILGPDGSTYLPVLANAVTANGYTPVDLPPGTYEVSVGTGTSLSASLIRIPYRQA